jgi:hypothetical protein
MHSPAGQALLTCLQIPPRRRRHRPRAAAEEFAARSSGFPTTELQPTLWSGRISTNSSRRFQSGRQVRQGDADTGRGGACWRPHRFLCFLCRCALRVASASGTRSPLQDHRDLARVYKHERGACKRFCCRRRAFLAKAEMPIVLMCGVFCVYYHYLT